MDTNGIVKVGILILVGIALWFAGTSIRACAAVPKEPEACNPTVVKVTGKGSITHGYQACSAGSEALPPEKIKDEDGKEIYIVRCVCTDNPAARPKSSAY